MENRAPSSAGLNNNGQIEGTQGILDRFKAGELNQLYVMHNKAPVYNPNTKTYGLDFRGRVTEGSVKNFQLVQSGLDPDSADVDRVLLQFGKCDGDNHQFRRWPGCDRTR